MIIQYIKDKFSFDFNIESDENIDLLEINSEVFYLLSKIKNIDNNFNFNIDEEDKQYLIENDIKVVFKFGNHIYYSNPNKVEFNDFSLFLFKEKENNLRVCNIHTNYELLNGVGDIPSLIKKSKSLGYTIISNCDKNTLAGVLPVQIECAKNEMKYVIGETITVKNDLISCSQRLKEISFYELKLYVKNQIGWQNLLKINKKINVDNEKFIYESELIQLLEGLILIFPVENGLLYLVERKKFIWNELIEFYKKYSDVHFQFFSFEYDNFDKRTENLDYLKFYLKNKYNEEIRPLYISDIYYKNAGENKIRESLREISKVRSDVSLNNYIQNTDEILRYYAKFSNEKDEFIEFFEEKMNLNTFISYVFEYTGIVFEKMEFNVELSKHKLPKYPFLPKNTNKTDYFLNLVTEGFERKCEQNEEYMERVARECEVIVQAGFEDYFLILWDIVNHARKNNILVGPGRGSVGGSLVAYCLNITDIDPIKFDLLFERFLNKTRVSGERAKSADALPDIDIDFESSKRDYMKEYIKNRFGASNVCSLGTYTRMKLKTCIKDLARNAGFQFDYINSLTKRIDDQIEFEWADIFRYALKDEELYKFVQKNYLLIEEIRSIINQPRAESVHPSAIIITPEYDENGNCMEVWDWLPVKKIDGILVSEWEGKYTDRVGFLKEDILGISQLDKFKNIVKLLGVDFDFNSIPLDDKPTYRLFQSGLNEDIFQFGSEGLKKFSKLVKPDHIEDLIAMNALYRPGPMESNAHIDYAEIKHGNKRPKYDYKLKSVTEKTGGLYIYQEQIMMAVVLLGNFTLNEADEVRTIMKKFDAKKMKSFGDKFINGAIENGCDSEEAKKIWNKLLAFSGYGFNRSHSAAYAIIAYWSQYFKANYALEFYTTALNFTSEDLIPFILNEIPLVDNSIIIKSVDINKSLKEFYCDRNENAIYWSITKIKGIGDKVADKFLSLKNGEEINSLSKFLDLSLKIGFKVSSLLVYSGGLDECLNLSNPFKRKEILLELHNIHKKPVTEELNGFQNKYDFVFYQNKLTGFGSVSFKNVFKENGYSIDPNYIEIITIVNKNSKEIKNLSTGGIVYKTLEKDSKKGKYLTMFLKGGNNEIIDFVLWNEVYMKLKEKTKNIVNKLVMIKNCYMKFDTFKGKNVIFGSDKTEIIFV